MTKLNGGLAIPLNDSAAPESHLPYDPQQLDAYKDYFSESAVEGEIPDSPMTKQLREEQALQNISQKHSAETEQVESKLLKRPPSGGNDVETPCFAPRLPPSKKLQTAHAAKSTIFSFAPVNEKIEAVPKCSSDPQPETSLCVNVDRRARSAPKSGEPVSTEAETHEAITVTSDRHHREVEEDVQDVEDPQEPEPHTDGFPSDTMDGTTFTEGSVQEPPPETKPAATYINVPSSPQRSPGSTHEASPGKNDAVEEALTPASPTTAPRSLGAPRTPKPRHFTSVLVTPAGVAKAHNQPRNRSGQKEHSGMVSEATTPSEEDLLYVLMHRCRERGDATKRSMTKIQTLELRNFELHAETQEISQERDNARAAQNEACERYRSLQANLEAFKSKYTKVKNFARSTHRDFVLLRQSADEQKASVQDLRQLGAQVQTSLRDAGTGVQNVRISLDKQRQGLAVIQSEADRIVSESTHASAELSASSGRIRELSKEKGRLQGHIVSLENAQQRATQAARNSNRDVSTALAKVTQRLDGIEFAALQPPQPSDAAKQCLALLQSLQQVQGPAAEEFQELAKSVATLTNTVVTGVQSIGRDYRNLQMMKRAEDSSKVVEQLKQYIEGLQLSATHVQHSNEERIGLEARLKGAQDMIEELQKSVARADSYVVTFQKGMETFTSTSNAQREQMTQLQSQRDQFQIRWNTKTSDLATTERELADRSQAMTKEIARLQGLLGVQRFERAVIEEDLRLARQASAESLDETTQELLIELSEKTTALEQAEAATSVARREGDEAAAVLAQELEDLRGLKSSLQAANDTLKSSNENGKSISESLQSTIESLQSADETRKTTNDSLLSTIETWESTNETQKTTIEALQSTIQTLESTNETRKSTNDLLQSTNETLQSTNQKIQSNARNAQQERERLQGQLKLALQEVEDAKRAGTQLKTVEARCEQAEKEVEQLRATTSQLDELQKQFTLQQKDADSKTAEVSRLREQLANAQKYPATIEQLSNKLKTAENDVKSLQEKLTEATAKATEVDELQARLTSKNATIEKLEAEATAGHEAQQQLVAVSTEKENLERDQTRVRGELEIAQQQVQKGAGLEERLRKQDEEMTQLRQQANRAEELSQSLDAQKEEYRKMDSQIASLRGELDRIKAESQESAGDQATNLGSQLADLDGFVSQQSYISFLQASQTQPVDSRRPHQLLDQSGTNTEEQPQRRVADRSTLRKPIPPPRRASQLDLEGSQPLSTNVTNVVPDSQMDAHLRDALGVDDPDPADQRDSSPLSAIQSDNGEPTGEGVRADGSSQPEIPETLQDNVGPLEQARGLRTQDDTFADRDVNIARPSSSATSVDLFKQHETNLEAATHPWKASQTNSIDQDHSRSVRGHGHPKPTPQSTVAPGQLHFEVSGALPSGKISPKHLRSGTQFRERYVTPSPDFGSSHVQEMMDITPTVHRERHQPNSAVKRSAEGDGPPAKRLERHPERLAIRSPSKPTNHLASGPSQSKTTPGSRRGGSVVGTPAPAPAPGKSQKSTRPPRKSSKKDKYSARFAESS